MNAGSIASVTVSYNGAKVLPGHLDALSRQERGLQEIIVVNNGSTDGTRELLAQRYPQVTVLNLPENVGVGGGFSAGLSYAAIERKHDWIWLFDNDSMPREDAGRRLEEAISSFDGPVNEIGMLTPVGVHSQTKARYYPEFWRDRFVKPSTEDVKEPIWFADFAMSSGSLVRRDVVESVGLPRSDFFMDGVDFEYCLRIRNHGYKIAVVNAAELEHSLGNPRRVKFFGITKVVGEHAPWRQYYLARNVVYVVWWLYPNRRAKYYLLRHLTRHACALFLLNPRGIASVVKMLQGVCDGRRAKLGIRFLPSF